MSDQCKRWTKEKNYLYFDLKKKLFPFINWPN